jgi:hypothetical protein
VAFKRHVFLEAHAITLPVGNQGNHTGFRTASKSLSNEQVYPALQFMVAGVLQARFGQIGRCLKPVLLALVSLVVPLSGWSSRGTVVDSRAIRVCDGRLDRTRAKARL